MINKKQIALSIAILTTITGVASANTGLITETQPQMMQTTSLEVKKTSPLEVLGVNVVDPNNLSVSLSGDLTNGISSTSDVKIFKDTKVLSSEKSTDDAKKIVVKLDEELDFGGYDYSLFSVSSIDTSIDFNLSSTSSGTIKNEISTEEGIDHIKLVDAKTIEVYMKKDLTSNLSDLKLLKEVKVESVSFENNSLNLKSINPLASKNNYFLMFISLKDNMGAELVVNNSMYDFMTPEFQGLSQDLATTQTGVLEGTGLTSTGVTGSGEIAIEQAAMTATATPDTGAKTNILLALALLSGLAFIALRKKALKN